MSGNSTESVSLPILHASECDHLDNLTWRSVCEVFQDGHMMADGPIDVMVSGVARRAGHHFISASRFAFLMADPLAPDRSTMREEIRGAIERGVEVFVPVCLRNHWMLTAITARSVIVYDSCWQHSVQYQLHGAIYGAVVQALGRPVNLIIPDCDQQELGTNNCGLYTVLHALYSDRIETLDRNSIRRFVAAQGRQRMGSILANLMRSEPRNARSAFLPSENLRGVHRDDSNRKRRRRGARSTPKRAPRVTFQGHASMQGDTASSFEPSVSTLTPAESTSHGSPCQSSTTAELDELRALRGDALRDYAKSGPPNECRYCRKMNSLDPDFLHSKDHRRYKETYKTKTERDRHINQVHLNLLQYVCPTCDAKFSNKYNGELHTAKRCPKNGRNTRKR